MENIDSGNIFLDIVDSLNNFDSFVEGVENFGFGDEVAEANNRVIRDLELAVVVLVVAVAGLVAEVVVHRSVVNDAEFQNIEMSTDRDKMTYFHIEKIADQQVDQSKNQIVDRVHIDERIRLLLLFFVSRH